MLRLAKYLKPYTVLILATIALLFIQANADLALPDYMSKIVNNGIQQGGVENAVPKAIRKGEMDKLVLLMSPENRSAVLGRYTLIDKNSADYSRYVKDYPRLADEPVYVLISVDSATINQLNPVMAKALLAVSGIEALQADPTKATGMGQGLGFDLSKLPPGTDLFALLARLPSAQIAQITAAVDKKFETLGNGMLVQSAVGSVKAEYAALGMDTARLQSNYIVRTGILMILLTLLSVVSTVAVGFLAARTAAGVARDMRKDVFRKVESFSNTEFDKFSTASLITRSTNDITQIQMVVIMMMRIVFYAPIMGVGGVIRAVGKSSSMWWIIAVGVVTLISIILVVFSVSLPKFKVIQSLIDRLNLV
ncbi:MAG: ABC transporter transmembrane domain-containing protein, partial [Anaerolineaceae bacterium]|nr:ABC transporter transmembrane domain-containing protein [Anaerolineaceae bacterium]